MSFFEDIKVCLTKKFFTTSGRANSSEFWAFSLFVAIVSLILIVVPSIIWYDGYKIGMVLWLIFLLLVLIPFVCVLIRRLHNKGIPGYSVWVMLLILPIPFLILFWDKTKDIKGENEYGPDPNDILPLDNSLTDNKEELMFIKNIKDKEDNDFQVIDSKDIK